MMQFAYEDEGFCRVMFRRTVDGQRYLYCWQQDNGEAFRFYRCSKDGEPSHEVNGWGGVPASELTPRNPGQTSVGRALNAFLKLSS